MKKEGVELLQENNRNIYVARAICDVIEAVLQTAQPRNSLREQLPFVEGSREKAKRILSLVGTLENMNQSDKTFHERALRGWRVTRC